MKNRQTNRHKNPLFMRLIALALTCAMAVSASNVSAFAADMLGDSSAYSSADASLDVSTGDSSTDPADSSEDSSGTTSADASDSSGESSESTGAEDASAGEEENATEDTGDPAGEAEDGESAADEAAADESAADEIAEAEAEAEAEIAVAAMEAEEEVEEEDEGSAIVTASSVTTTGYVYHIDIGVKASASVTIGSTTYSNSSIGITTNDFSSSTVTISAKQGTTTLTGSYSSSDWTRTQGDYNPSSGTYDYTYKINDTSKYDYVYNLNDLTSSTGYYENTTLTQVRIGGCFPTGTQSNPVEYTLTLTKTVRLYANGNTSSSDYIEVPVTLSATFDYWDEDNGCPGIQDQESNTESWEKGNVIDNSGLDFLLTSTSATQPSITVYKYVVDESGNLLSEASGESYSYTVTSGGSDVTGSITVGDSGVGVATINVKDVSDVEVTEDTDALEDDTITVGGVNYTYKNTTYSTYNATDKTITITNIYGVSTTSVTVTKTWDDNNYAGRPSSIDVTLFAGDEEYETATLTAADGWTYTFTNLPVKDSNNDDIEYTVKEEIVDGYTSAVDGYTITNTLDTGSLTLSKVVKADSSIDTSSFTYTFYVSGFADGVTSVTDSSGKTYSVSGGVATVTVPADGSVTLVDLPVGTYTVYETEGTTNTTVTANGYTWTVSDDDQSVDVTKGGTASATITNTIKYTGIIEIVKNWADDSNRYDTRPDSITVTLTGTGTDGITYEYSFDATDAYQESTNVWEFEIPNVEFFDTNGVAITYTVTETLTYADGSTNYYTTEFSAEEITPGKYISEDRNLTITNTLKTGSVSVSKSVDTASSSDTNNTDVFTIGLVAYTYDETTNTYTRAYDSEGNAITYTYTVSDEVGWSHVFSDLPLGYYWSISEWTTNDGGVHSYDMSLIIDGTDVSDQVTKALNSSNNKWTNTYRYFYLDSTTQVVISMTNVEEEISVDLKTFLEGTKTLTGDPGSDLTFNYTVTHGGETVATGTSTVSANSTSDITWTVTDESAFVYSETGTYNYVITETVTNEAGIVFDSTRYTLIVTVSEDTTDGHLIATVTMTKNVEDSTTGERETTYVTTTGGADSIVVADYETTLNVTDSFSADFTNTYDADETSIIFRARKTLNGRTLSAGEFSVDVTEYTDSTYTTEGDEDGDGYSTITRSNGADGNMGFEVVYDTAGTYYYTVTENDVSKSNVEYDDTIYYIRVEVVTGTNTNGESALQVKSAEYSTDMSTWTDLYENNELIYLSFTNTYEDTTTVDLNNIASKTLTGRTLAEGEFTFLLVPEGTAGNSIVPDGATVATADDPYVEAGYVTEGQWYIEATNNADDSINFGSITYDQSQVGTYTYKVIEIDEGANGVTYDTSTTGKLIYVTVYYNSTTDDLETSVSTSGLDNETVTITNTFDQGTVDLYGTKVWVDGGQTHDNENEITLRVYSYTDVNPSWVLVDSSTYTVTWFTNGDWHIAGTGLTEFDSAGNKMYYVVTEASVSGYTTTYSTTDGEAGTIPEDNSSTNRYTITNTIEQDYMTISGTKTWVEPDDENGEAPTHNNAEELVLTVTRNSESTSLTELTQEDGDGTGADGTYIVVWSGDTYNIYWYYDADAQDYVGLPVYDASGYTYYYNVAESYAAAYADDYADYTIETDWELVGDNEVTFDFTNRAPDDDSEDPVKTETKIVSDNTTTTPTGTLNGETVTEETALTSSDTVTYKATPSPIITWSWTTPSPTASATITTPTPPPPSPSPTSWTAA